MGAAAVEQVAGCVARFRLLSSSVCAHASLNYELSQGACDDMDACLDLLPTGPERAALASERRCVPLRGLSLHCGQETDLIIAILFPFDHLAQ